MPNEKPTLGSARRQKPSVSQIVRASKRRLCQDAGSSHWKQNGWNDSVSWISSAATFIPKSFKLPCRRSKSSKTHLHLLPGKPLGSCLQPFLKMTSLGATLPPCQCETWGG